MATPEQHEAVSGACESERCVAIADSALSGGQGALLGGADSEAGGTRAEWSTTTGGGVTLGTVGSGV